MSSDHRGIKHEMDMTNVDMIHCYKDWHRRFTIMHMTIPVPTAKVRTLIPTEGIRYCRSGLLVAYSMTVMAAGEYVLSDDVHYPCGFMARFRITVGQEG